MDKELIEGLSNLSASLDKISEALSKRGEPKSATGAALKMGDFDKQIREISMSISEVKRDTQRLLDQQDTILKMMNQSKTDTPGSKINKVTAEPTASTIGKIKSDEKIQEDKLTESSLSKMKKFFSELTTPKMAREKKEEVNFSEKKFDDRSGRKTEVQPTTVKILKEKERERDLSLKESNQRTKSEVSLWNRLFPNKSLNEKVKILSDYFTKGIPSKDDKKVKKTDTELTTVKIQIEKQQGDRTVKESKTVKAFSKEPTTVRVSKDKTESTKEYKDTKIKKVSDENTTVRVSKDKTESTKESKDTKIKKVSDEPTTTKVAKEKREERKEVKEEKSKGGMFGNMDTKKIKDGVSAILLIAVGIVAIGLALKLVGKIDFVSVMSIALALPLIAIAFAKIASVFSGKEVTDERGRKSRSAAIDIKQLPAIILGLVGFSAAITASSYILSKVKPIGVAQAVTAILIGGVFSALSFGLHKLVGAFGKMSLLGGVKAVLFMPVVLVAVSTAIALSSYVLSAVKPIGIFQAVTAILIAGVFSVLGYGIGKLIRAFRGIDPVTAYMAAKMMPIVLLAVTATIAAASYLLSAVKPIGFFQALTAILIAGVFTVLSFGIGKIIGSFRRIDPATALAATSMMPLIFIALSFSIMMSSYFLGNVKVIGLFQALTAIAISIVFVALSFGLAKILPAFRRLSPADVTKAAIGMPIIFTALSFAIMVSSYFISGVKPIGFAQFLTAVGISILFVGFAFATKFIVKGLRGVTTAQVINAMKSLLIVATTVAIASFIVAASPTVPFMKALQFGLLGIGLGATTVVMAIAIKTIKKIGLGLKDILTGGLMILAIATTIALSSVILNMGTYEKYPGAKWALGVGASLVGFGLAAVVLGSIASSGIGALAILAGLASILAIAGTIVLTDKIISAGTYQKYPGAKWILGVGATMVGFGLAAVTLGGIIVGTLGLGGLAIAAGLVAVIGIAETIVKVDKIIAKGSYTKSPGVRWILGVGSSMVGFGLAAVTLGGIIVGTLGLGGLAIKAGLSAVESIAKTIVKTDKILSAGQYTKYPGASWALTVGSIITAFSTAVLLLGAVSSGGGLLQKLSLGLVKNPIDSGIQAIKKIAQAIVDVDKKLAEGSYTKGPNPTWAKGISTSLSAFSPIYRMLLAEKLMSFIGGVSAKDFAQAIKVISGGIVDSAKLFESAKVAFKDGPPVSWAKGVSTALGAFSSIYSLLVKDKIMSIFGSGISPNDFSQAIKTISGGIVDAAKLFGNASVAFKSGPPVEWAKGISKALGAFSSIYSLLVKDRIMSIFGAGVSPKDFSQAIKTISGGIVDSAKLFEKASVAFKNGPPVEWANGVSKALGAFSSIYKLLASNSGWWKSGVDPKMYAQAIVTITNGIVTAAKAFGSASVAFKNGPPVEWADGVGKSLSAFQPIYELLLKNSGWWKSGIDPKMYAQAIVTMTGGIVTAAKAFGSASVAFRNGPPVEWADGVGKSLAAFQPIYELLLKNTGWWKSNIDPKKYAQAIVTITGGIVTAAKSFGSASVAFKNGPPVEWADGVGKALSVFQPVYEMLSRNASWWRTSIDPKKYAEAIVTITGGIVTAGKAFGSSSVAFKNGPPVEWARGVGRALQVFQPIYEMLSRNASWWRTSIDPKKYAEAIVTITGGIVTAGKAFGSSSVAFKNGPPVEWARGVGRALSVFQPIYEMLSRNASWWRTSIDPKKYAEAIVTITGGIVTAGKAFGSASVAFKNGPPIEWASGVGKSLAVFQPIYEMLSRNASWWRSTIEPKKYVEAIVTITGGIITAAKSFSQASVAFKNGPPVEWALGVGKALSAFQPVYELLVRNSSWWKSTIDPKKYAEAIVTITGGIVTAGKSFGAAAVAFKNGPSVQWSEGVGKALSAFQPVYEMLVRNASWWKSSIDPKKYSEAIRTISRGITDAALVLSTAAVAYRFYPTEQWAAGVSRALTAFQPIYKILQKDSGWLRSGISPKMYADAIKTITTGIRDSAMILASASIAYRMFPTVQWANGVSRALSTFQPIYKILQKDSGWLRSNISPEKYATAIKTITTGIRDSAMILASAAIAYRMFPTVQWANGVSRALSTFQPIYKILQKDSGWFRSNISPEKYATAIKTITTGIRDSAVILASASLAYRMFPTVQWADGVSKALSTFHPIYKILQKDSGWFRSNISPDKYAAAIRTISQGIVDSALILAKAKTAYKSYPTTEWADGVSRALSAFQPIYTILQKDSGWFKSGVSVSKYSDAIKTLSMGIVDSANILSKGLYKIYPTVNWVMGISGAFAMIPALIKKVNNIDFKGLSKIWMISDSIYKLSIAFKDAKFTSFPSKKWTSAISSSFTMMINLLKSIDKSISITSLLSGILKSKALVNYILDLDKKFSLGKFSKFPNSSWVNGSTKSISEFAKLLSELNKLVSLVGLKTGQFKVSSILKSVLEIDGQISRGKFNRVISQKWSSSLRVSILEFSNLFKNVDKLVSIIDLKLGQTKVTSIIKSILQIDLQISKGKFNKFIDNKWIKGTKSSIMEFGGLFKTIDKLVSIIALKLGQTKVTSIIKSILQIDSQVSKGKFNKFIDNKWIKGTKQSVLEFGKLFIDVNKNFSVTSLLLGFNKVKMIFDNIIWIDNKISRAKFEKSPPSKWLTNTRDSIVYYGKLAIDSNKMFGTVPLIAGIKKIKTLVDTILWVDKTLAKGKYNRVPSLKWLNESKNAIFTYGKIAIDSNKIFPLISLIAGIKKVKMISETIIWVDKTLSRGKYTKVPTQNWLTRSKSTIFQYGNLAIESNKRFGMIGLFWGLKKVRNIADTLKYVSLVISGGNYTKFPSLEWSKSVPAAISGFMNLPFKGIFGEFFDFIFGASEDSKKSQLGKIVDLMLYVDKRFQSGNWKKFPTVEWVKGTILALQKFKDIVSLLSFGSLNTKIMTAFGGKNPLVTAVSNIEKLAQSFDKLGSSMKNFSQSIKTLDTEKLAAIKSLSSNVILMSLMNPEQFDAMLSKLEERSGVFADLMKDVQDKKATSGKTTAAPGGGQKVAGGGTMTDFKMVPSSTGARMSGKSDDAKMLEKLDAMTSLLADISSVVGSKGALKTYLGSLKEDVDIGDGGFSLFSRSDKRTKNILKKVGVSPNGINIYLFSYKFDPTVVYQGVIAQELLGTIFEKSVVLDKSGYYAVDYSKLDVEFKRTN